MPVPPQQARERAPAIKRPPNHHPSAALIVSHVAGALPAGLSLAVEAHIDLCAQCHDRAGEAEAVAGVLLEDVPPSELDPAALDRVLARIDAPSPRRTTPPRALGTAGIPGLPPHLPPSLRRAVAGGSGRPWRFLAPGIRHIDLAARGDHGSARLLRIAPGSTLPRHGHAGLELTLILSGSFSDELGRFGPGDLAEVEDDIIHQPIADTDEDCVCLIATAAPLRFTGLMGRLMQPLIGI